MMSKTTIIIIIVLLVSILLVAFIVSPEIIDIFNKKENEAQKIDTLKKIEVIALDLLINYSSDESFYKQYINSNVAEERLWAMSAQGRANRIVEMYNILIIENNFSWTDGLPDALKVKIPFIK